MLCFIYIVCWFEEFPVNRTNIMYYILLLLICYYYEKKTFIFFCLLFYCFCCDTTQNKAARYWTKNLHKNCLFSRLKSVSLFLVLIYFSYLLMFSKQQPITIFGCIKLMPYFLYLIVFCFVVFIFRSIFSTCQSRSSTNH